MKGEYQNLYVHESGDFHGRGLFWSAVPRGIIGACAALRCAHPHRSLSSGRSSSAATERSRVAARCRLPANGDDPPSRLPIRSPRLEPCGNSAGRSAPSCLSVMLPLVAERRLISCLGSCMHTFRISIQHLIEIWR